MNIGIIGLGRMGQAIACRLLKNNFTVLGYDPIIKTSDNITLVKSLKELCEKTNIFWLMVPAGETIDNIIQELLPNMKKGSIIIDGGNSYYKDSVKRYTFLIKRNIYYLDCGTSGGLQGKDLGFCLMIGGDQEIFKKCEEIFKVISYKDGYEYVGPSGAGHYVKMVHNGIEYSLLQAYAEGFDLLKNNKKYKDLNLSKIARVWNQGSIIRSWILSLSKEVFDKDQDFKNISGEIGENLTGQWTSKECEEEDVKMILLEKTLGIRKWSRRTGGSYATKLVAMLRNKFGGHEVKKI